MPDTHQPGSVVEPVRSQNELAAPTSDEHALHDAGRRTQAVHYGARRSQYGEVAEALYMTQGFVYPTAEAAEARFTALGEDEFIYARYGNPTTRVFEDRMAALEGTETAFATASGMAAVHGALMAVARPGVRIVAARALFGSCLYVLDLLAGFGVDVVYVDGTDLAQWKAAVNDETAAVFFETISNPTLEVIDVAAVAAVAHDAGALVIVDNVFATPVFSRAVDLGVDVVVYSATKHVDGSGRAMGGLICGTSTFVNDKALPFLKHTGGAISPFNAWLMLGALPSLDLRVRAQAQSAQALAEALQGQSALENVIYPGLPDHPHHDLNARQMSSGGTMIAVDVRGGKDVAFSVMNQLRLWTISNNLGDARSIITHPATTTHQRLGADHRARLGITDGLLRLSVGLEDVADLISDLEQALGHGEPSAN